MVDGYEVRVEPAGTDTIERYLFETNDAARTEYTGRENAEIRETPIPVLDTAGETYWDNAFSMPSESAGPGQVNTLIPVWAASLIDVDGVYWNHPVDVANYTAPRGLIYQDQRDDWTQRIEHSETQ